MADAQEGECCSQGVTLPLSWENFANLCGFFALKNTKKVFRGGDKPVNPLPSTPVAEQVPRCRYEMCYAGRHGLASSPSALRSGELSQGLWVPGRRRVPSFPGLSMSTHEQSATCYLPCSWKAIPWDTSAMWLSKYKQNGANFLTRLDLGGEWGRQ